MNDRHVTNCISLCEAVGYGNEGFSQLSRFLDRTCREAGFDGCERVYVGSYVCENFFMGLSDRFHEEIGELCYRYDMTATLVVPIFGQAFLERCELRLDHIMDRFGHVYDEAIVNDVARYFSVSELYDIRIGLGRLFSKEQRDARVPHLMQRTVRPALSAESLECIDDAHANGYRPLVEIDPVCRSIDASSILDEAPDAEIALHAPFCLATTGRNCGPACAYEPDDKKFRLGQGCTRHCLRMRQGCKTREGVTYLKHGRAYYFPNPHCQMNGTPEWRIVYAVAHETMR